jgi:hypothetical protein
MIFFGFHGTEPILQRTFLHSVLQRVFLHSGNFRAQSLYFRFLLRYLRCRRRCHCSLSSFPLPPLLCDLFFCNTNLSVALRLSLPSCRLLPLPLPSLQAQFFQLLLLLLQLLADCCRRSPTLSQLTHRPCNLLDAQHINRLRGRQSRRS